jgi:hypothetical protein
MACSSVPSDCDYELLKRFKDELRVFFWLVFMANMSGSIVVRSDTVVLMGLSTFLEYVSFLEPLAEKIEQAWPEYLRRRLQCRIEGPL